MEVGILVQALVATLSADSVQRRQAEKYLVECEQVSNFPVLLLEIVGNNGLENYHRQAAAIKFKNVVEKKWELPPLEGISEKDRTMLKERVVELMLSSPPLIQLQLSKAINLIGAKDFPEHWTELIPTLNQRMETNYAMAMGSMQAMQSLTEKYEHSFASDPLYLEIKYVLTHFAPNLTILAFNVWNTIKLISDPNANNSNNNTAKLYLGVQNNISSLPLMIKLMHVVSEVFYSLNFQDLPEYFEDNMDRWMLLFLEILTYQHSSLVTQDAYDSGALIPMKAQVCVILHLYASKYDEEDLGFSKYFMRFIGAVWELLISTGLEPKFDALVGNAMRFLSSLALKSACKPIFAQRTDLDRIFNGIIMPNMQLREADEDLFESEPDEYISRDIEGADLETRRRGAVDLLKSLRALFNETITEMTGQYVQQLLNTYNADPIKNWKNKDTAIFLMASITVTSSNMTRGATLVNTLIPIASFFPAHILPVLEQQDVNSNPILKADAVKFIHLFRNQMSDADIKLALPHLIRLLASNYKVVTTYAAFIIDRLLCMRATTPNQTYSNNTNAAQLNQSSAYRLASSDIIKFSGDIFSLAFSSFTRPDNSENVYLIRCILRVITILKQDLTFVEQITELLCQRLRLIVKAPPRAEFTYLIFETISATIRYGYQDNQQRIAGLFEPQLLPIFQEMLQNDDSVIEFQPYLLQILSQLLHLRQGPAPSHYLALLDPILSGDLWDSRANVPGLVALLQLLLTRDSLVGANESAFSSNKLDQVLIISHRLIDSPILDEFGVSLLLSFLATAPKQIIDGRARDIMQMLLQRLTKNKTIKFTRLFLIFFSTSFGKYGAQYSQELVDSFQQGLFHNVIGLYKTDGAKAQSYVQRKIMAIGLSSMLCHCPAMITTYKDHYIPMLELLLKYIANSHDENEHAIEDTDDFDTTDNMGSAAGFHAAFNRLLNAQLKEFDPFATILNERLYFTQLFNQFTHQNPVVIQFIQTHLAPPSLSLLHQVLNNSS